MRKPMTAALAAIALVALGSPTLTATANPAGSDTAASYIVVLKDSAASEKWPENTATGTPPR